MSLARAHAPVLPTALSTRLKQTNIITTHKNKHMLYSVAKH